MSNQAQAAATETTTEKPQVRIRAKLDKYTVVAAASGRKSYDNGDQAAEALRGKPLDEVYATVLKAINVERKANDEKVMTLKELKGRYDHLNIGHQRMCLGNLLRGCFNRS